MKKFLVLLLALLLLLATFRKAEAVSTTAYDRCEAENWTPTLLWPNITQQLKSANYAERWKALEFSNINVNQNGTYDNFQCTLLNPTNIPALAPWTWGFWFKLYQGVPNASLYGLIGLYDMTYSDSLTLEWSWNTDHYEALMRANGGAGGGSANTWTVTPGDWNWIEITYQGYYDGSEAGLWVNGTHKGSRLTVDCRITNNSRINIYHATGGAYCWGNVWLDYMRFASGVEFPPTNPAWTVDVTFMAKNIETNTNISLPLLANGTGGSTPFTINVYPGTLEAVLHQTWDYNSSHFYRFQNWSDGNTELVRSLTITETQYQDFTIYYLLERNWDPGGWINFFIGIVGLILIGSSWIILKILWSDGEYAKALGLWLAFLLIGFGLSTVLMGG